MAAERELRAHPHTAAVLDLGLHLKDGTAVLEAVRGASVSLPVLVLTAREALRDRIRGIDIGIDIGIDDYIVKPVDLHELGARLRALVRRAGRPIASSAREFDLLHTLILNVQDAANRLDAFGTLRFSCATKTNDLGD